MEKQPTVINVNKFKPRSYQLPLLRAIENQGKKRALVIWPRRAGKDVTVLNLCIRACIRKPIVCYYIFPTYSQAKKVIWDSLTNTGERILDYIPRALIDSSNSQELKIRFKNGSLFQLVGSDNYDCFDNKTEILTEYGWKLFKDLSSEKVATLDMGGYANRFSDNYTPTTELVYEKPIKYVEYDYDGDMYAVKNSSIDFVVTPNHRFYVKSTKGKYKFKVISDPTIRHDMIPSTCDWNGLHRPEILGYKSEDFIAFVGIFLAEGSTYKNNKCNRITISQTKQSGRHEIKELLKRMGLNYVETPDRFNIENIKLYDYCAQFGLQHERFIPKDIKALHKDLLIILFDWLVLGDGHRCKTYTAYYSTSKELIDDVQEVIIKLGLSGNVNIKNQKPSVIRGRIVTPKHTLYEIKVRHSKFKRLHGASGKPYIHTVPYKGKVYCVSVRSGVIKVRRKGKEYWSGNSLMGTNPQLCVFSEYALQDPRAYQFIRPILTANDGTAIFVSTPRGKNHLWELYNIALNHPDWFCEKLTVEDTCHIDLEDIDRDRASGEMSEDLIQQEYYTSFDMGVEGAYYAKYMDRMRVDGRIGMIPFETGFKVHTAWDIGVRDSTVIIFFQVIGRTVKIISAYDNTKEGLEHYIQYLQRIEIDRGYIYGKHFAPHDIAVTEWGSGVSRAEKARELGLKFELVRDNVSGKTRSVVPNVSIMDGIETVRSTFSKLWIDLKNCDKLVRALENYRQEFDPKKKVYKHFPLHDWSSHYADCMRYLCLVLPRIQMSNSSPEELDKRYREAVYGNDHGGFFGHNPHGRN